jgi:hypothetical protein
MFGRGIGEDKTIFANETFQEVVYDPFFIPIQKKLSGCCRVPD